MSKDPYLMYSLEAKIINKGVGFNIRDAVYNFLRHRGLEGKFIDFQTTSDNFTGILAIYDNNELDLNISALLDHLGTSGALPTKESLRPNVIIKPIIPDQFKSIVQPASSKNDDHWIKALEDVHEEYKISKEGLEQRINDLNNVLARRQKVIDQKHSKNKHLIEKIDQLEKELEKDYVTQFDHPLAAIIECYLKQSIEIVFDTFADYKLLEGNNDLDLFLNLSDTDIELHDYFNLKFGTSYNQEEFENWLENLKENNSWENSEKARELISLKNKLTNDLEFLEKAAESGVSKEMLEAMKNVVNQFDPEEINRKISDYKAKFEKELKIFERIDDITKGYNQFAEAIKNSLQRKEKNAQFPLVLYGTKGNSPKLELYVPSFDPQGPLHDHLKNMLGKLLESEEDNYALSAEHKDIILTIKVQPAKDIDVQEQQKFYQTLSEKICSQVLDDGLISKLGVKQTIYSLVHYS